jgi:hypothetical protein
MIREVLGTAAGVLAGTMFGLLSGRLSAERTPTVAMILSILCATTVGLAAGGLVSSFAGCSAGGAVFGALVSIPGVGADLGKTRRWKHRHSTLVLIGLSVGCLAMLLLPVSGKRVVGALGSHGKYVIEGAMGLTLLTAVLVRFGYRVPWRERVHIGQYYDETERGHVARYNFARALCVGKTVADMACGTGYGTEILRSVAVSVDGYDKEDLGIGNRVVDLDGEHWNRRYDVIVSFETLEHLACPEFFLRNVSESCELLILSSPLNERLGESPFHKQAWSFEQLTPILEKYFTCSYCFQRGDEFVQERMQANMLIAICRPAPPIAK